MTNNGAIWIFEDDESSQFVYREILQDQYAITFFDSMESLRTVNGTKEGRPDLLIIDLLLSDGCMLDNFGSSFSSILMEVPWIVVSSVDEEAALRSCFSYGALDYLIKPFRKSELLVKIQRLLKSKKDTPLIKNISERPPDLDLLKRTISVSEDLRVELTPRELQIAKMLLDNYGAAVGRTELFKTVWNDARVTDKTLDIHLVSLRKKLHQIGLRIQLTTPGKYQLNREA